MEVQTSTRFSHRVSTEPFRFHIPRIKANGIIYIFIESKARISNKTIDEISVYVHVSPRIVYPEISSSWEKYSRGSQKKEKIKKWRKSTATLSGYIRTFLYPRAYIPSYLRASEKLERVKDIFRRSRRHVKGSVSNRCATIHSNDCSFAARPQRFSTLPAVLVPAAILLPPCRLHTLFHPFRALCCAPSSFSRSQPPLHRRKPTVHSFPFPTRPRLSSFRPATPLILFPPTFLDYRPREKSREACYDPSCIYYSSR